MVMLSTLQATALLGWRFVDPPLEENVMDGLRVVAWPASRPQQRREAFRSASGVYAFARLPGMTGAETARRFVVEISDHQQRFLPLARAARISPKSLSEDSRLLRQPLYSAPTRRLAPGFVVVRGELFDLNGNRPAAHARVRLQLTDQATVQARSVFETFADAGGRFALFLPAPIYIETLNGNGIQGPTPIDQRRWPMVLEVFYEPDAWIFLPGTAIPDHHSLAQQSLARVRRSSSVTETSLSWTGELAQGQDNVVRTLDRSRLLVEPGTA